MPDDVQLVSVRPPTEMEYVGSVQEGVVETEAVAWVSRLRSPSFMLALYSFTLYCFTGFVRKNGILQHVI